MDLTHDDPLSPEPVLTRGAEPRAGAPQDLLLLVWRRGQLRWITCADARRNVGAGQGRRSSWGRPRRTGVRFL